MSDLPAFDRPEHEFQVGEKVYVIEETEFDIFEAEIQEIGEETFSVHYMEFPDDDGKVAKARVLVQSEKNKSIFEEQEEIRNAKDNEEEEEEAAEEKEEAAEEKEPEAEENEE